MQITFFYNHPRVTIVKDAISKHWNKNQSSQWLEIFYEYSWSNGILFLRNNIVYRLMYYKILKYFFFLCQTKYHFTRSIYVEFEVILTIVSYYTEVLNNNFNSNHHCTLSMFFNNLLTIIWNFKTQLKIWKPSVFCHIFIVTVA